MGSAPRQRELADLTGGLGRAKEAHGTVDPVGAKEAFADLTIVERE